MPLVIVVGLGPADADLVTSGALAAIERTPTRFLRTTRHPAAHVVGEAASFDDLYEQADTFEQVYGRIVDRLAEAADRHERVVYAVPGSPLVAERTVELLLADPRVEVEVVPGLSFLDLAWARLGVDPLARGVRLVDGRRFAVEAAGQRGPLLVAQCDTPAVLSDVKLAVGDAFGDPFGDPLDNRNGHDAGSDADADRDDPPEGSNRPAATVTVLQRLGLPDERITEVGWDDLDREVEPDHLTSLWIPSLAAPVAAELVAFDELVHTLRERCPWDREQTHASLTRHLVEETYETVEAIEQLDTPGGPDHLCEELGDVLFQVVFHATLAAEEGWFTLADVARTVHDKLVHRHPHVFGPVGSVEAETSGQVLRNWEQIKQTDRGHASVMDGLPSALPALLYAHKVQRKAASTGFDWPSVDGAYAKVVEELDEVRADPGDDEVGDLLFASVEVARHLGIDPEAALRSATAKFRDRFRLVEQLAGEQGVDLAAAGTPVLEALWAEAKAVESRG